MGQRDHWNEDLHFLLAQQPPGIQCVTNLQPGPGPVSCPCAYSTCSTSLCTVVNNTCIGSDLACCRTHRASLGDIDRWVMMQIGLSWQVG